MKHKHFLLCILVVWPSLLAKGVLGFACNWGRVSTQPLQGDIAVKLMKDNGFDKVKLFEAEPEAMEALANSDIQVMVGIANVYLESLTNTEGANDWVAQNVSEYVKIGVDIRYVAVGNEPFLQSYGDKFLHTLLPAMKNIKASLDKAGLGKKVQVTTPLNADIYDTASGLPSGGDFRSNVTKQVVEVLEFLSKNSAPLTINIYPFLSLYYDAGFPKEFAFFDAKSDSLADGEITYTNAFDGTLDTLVAALEKNGAGSMPIIVGEVGWPTDGAASANIANAERFYRGLIDRINLKKGTPKRPNGMPEVYMFGLLDENAKSIEPGDFEPHWGIFNYDGSVKYQVESGSGKTKKLVAAKGVKYLQKQWCVLSPDAKVDDPLMEENLKMACGGSTGCTNVANGSSCEWLDSRTNASYIFNAYYQFVTNQSKDGCVFNGLSVITDKDPSPPNGTCKFYIGLDVLGQLGTSPSPAPDPDMPSLGSRSSGPKSKSLAPAPTTEPGADTSADMLSFGFRTKKRLNLIVMVITMVFSLICLL